MPIYDILKRVIARGGYDAADIRAKLNLFALYDQITTEQYIEIMGLMA